MRGFMRNKAQRHKGAAEDLCGFTRNTAQRHKGAAADLRSFTRNKAQRHKGPNPPPLTKVDRVGISRRGTERAELVSEP